MSEARPGSLLLGKGWFPDETGGLNRYYRDLAESLHRVGENTCGVVIGSAPDAPPWIFGVSEATRPLPVRIASFARRAARAARDCEVVDVHFALYAALPVVLGPLRRVPAVVHFHGPWAEESRAVGQRGGGVLAKRALEKAVYSRAHRVVVLSAAFRRIVVEDYGVPPWMVEVIAPGVDLRAFSPGDREAARSRLGAGPDAWIACSVRRLVPRMGLDLLIAAWPEVVAVRPDAVLLICGDGPARRDLEAAARRHRIAGNVRFLGRVEEATLVDVYRAADLSVVPSVTLEGFGLVTLESMACGTPVVVTDAGGLGELPSQLDPTTVVPAGDRAALAARLRAAANGDCQLPERAACRKLASEHDWQSVALRHAALYRSVARGPTDSERRIVFLDHVAELSGGELALLRTLPALDGVKPHVILAADGPLVRSLLAGGFSVEVLPMAARTRDLRRDRTGRAPAAAWWDTARYVVRLARRLRRLRPDLVHANSLKSGMYGLAATRLAGVPMVWHLRDRVADDYLPRRAVRLVQALAGRFPAALIANSTATMETVPRRAARQVRAVVPSPVCPSVTPSPPGDRAELTVGMLGRLAPWKGQDVFLRAFASAFGDGRERAVLIGAALFGEDEYLLSLDRLADSLAISARVEMRGHREDVGSELARLDILVHASVTPEPFGQVVVEGMAAGLPVVASAAGGPTEVITDGVDGLLVPPGDVDQLARALSTLASDEGLRARLGRAAAERATDFSPSRVGARLGTVYAEVEVACASQRGVRLASRRDSRLLPRSGS